MVWKLLLLGGFTLFMVKLLFKTRWRELGPRLDRFVDVALFAIVVVYAGYFLWQLVTRAPSQ